MLIEFWSDSVYATARAKARKALRDRAKLTSRLDASLPRRRDHRVNQL